MLAPIEFDVQTGFDDSVVQDHVRATLMRGLPVVGRGNPTLTPAYVYANGPSAKDAPKHWPAIALNGAYRLFKDSPQAWIACDAQALVADFVSNPWPDTQYLVASKCHQAVFEQLEGCDVRVWHVGDCGAGALPEGTETVPTAVSVTICALGLLHRLGHRDVTVYGWDCCYIDGKDHAVAQGHVGQDVTVLVGDQMFFTTTTWCAEVEDAYNYLRLYPDLRVTIPGPGMVGAILRQKGVPNVV